MTATLTTSTPAHAELRAQAKAKLEAAGAIAAKADDAGRDFTTDERGEVKTLMEEARDLKARADELAGDSELRKALADLGSALTVDHVDATDPNLIGGTLAGLRSRKTLGDRFVENPAFKAWHDGLGPNGRIPDTAKGITSPPLHFGGFKDLITGGSDTSGGALVDNDWRGLLDLGTDQRPLTAANLITGGTTTSDVVEYARVTGFTNNAAIVPEAEGTSAGDASGDVAGTKPESDLALEKVTTNVGTLAHWIPATKRALSDAGQIRTLIDNFLRYGLLEELEDQIVNGDGTGDNFEGILNVSGTQPQAWDTDILVTTRKARTKVRTVGRTSPTAYLLNPADNEEIDLTKDDNGGFYFGGPAGMGVQTLWGLPRVECEAVPEGTGIVGNFRMAVLWDREAASIMASDSHADFFVRNLVAILAEMRAAFGIIRPSAFVIIDLTA